MNGQARVPRRKKLRAKSCRSQSGRAPREDKKHKKSPEDRYSGLKKTVKKRWSRSGERLLRPGGESKKNPKGESVQSVARRNGG